jgi:hypothetical protein
MKKEANSRPDKHSFLTFLGKTVEKGIRSHMTVLWNAKPEPIKIAQIRR